MKIKDKIKRYSFGVKKIIKENSIKNNQDIYSCVDLITLFLIYKKRVNNRIIGLTEKIEKIQDNVQKNNYELTDLRKELKLNSEKLKELKEQIDNQSYKYSDDKVSFNDKTIEDRSHDDKMFWQIIEIFKKNVNEKKVKITELEQKIAILLDENIKNNSKLNLYYRRRKILVKYLDELDKRIKKLQSEARKVTINLAKTYTKTLNNYVREKSRE